MKKKTKKIYSVLVDLIGVVLFCLRISRGVEMVGGSTLCELPVALEGRRSSKDANIDFIFFIAKRKN